MVGVGRHCGELQLIDAEIEEVHDGGHEAGLSCAGRAMELILTLLGMVDACLVLTPAAKRVRSTQISSLIARLMVSMSKVEGWEKVWKVQRRMWSSLGAAA